MLDLCLFILIFLGFSSLSRANSEFEKDPFPTTEGDLEIVFIGHGSLVFYFQDKTIHVDPYSELADYSKQPRADIVLITHDHHDHLDMRAIDLVKKENTSVVLTEACSKKVGTGLIMKNGEEKTIKGIKIEAVAAYNIQHKRDNGEPFHSKGEGNGYIINFAGLRVYIAGDTENIPEMEDIKNIDIAFLPMNLPYTMTPEMVAAAARAFKPKVLYPYHFGATDTKRLSALLKDREDIEIRLRKMS